MERMNIVNFEDGHCKRLRSYLDSYLNNELMVETNHDVIRHLEACEDCSRLLEDRARLKAQLKRAVMHEYAPAALRERIGSDLRRGRGFSFSRLSIALAVATAALVIAAVTFFTGGPPKNQLSQNAGLETRDHLVFVVSNETSDANLQIARSLGPSVRDLLVRLES